MKFKFLKCLAAGAILGSLALASCGEPNTLTTPTQDVNGVDITLRDGLTKESPLCISKAIEKCAANDSETRYYVKGEIISLQEEYGTMTIKDITGELYVYGSYGADGVDRYNALANKPVVGDTVLLYATLVTYNGTPEVKSGWIIDFGSHLVDENPIAGGQGSSDDKKDDVTTVSDGLSVNTAFTIKDALTQCSKDDSKEYYITGKVKAIKSYTYGEMTLAGEDGSELYIFGVHGANDEFFDALDSSARPEVGDTVVLKGVLTTHNGVGQGGAKNQQMKIQKLTKADKTFNEKDYTAMTLKQAREAEDGTKVKVTGVVTKITVDSASAASGVFITDGESSIYLYGANIAIDAKVGYEITVYGEKDYWILETEQSSANKYGYGGCCQISNCTLGNIDKTEHTIDLSWCEEKTIKELIDTDVSEDITTLTYKVTCLIKYAPGTKFNNVYFMDLDGETGNYIYSQNNGGSIEHLAKYDGKICTVYMTIMNAKSSASGCAWRFMDISVAEEDVQFDLSKTADFVMTYYAYEQFESVYYGDPVKELVTSVDSELLGFTGATISYTSSNTDAFYIEDGILHTKNSGTSTITINVSYGSYDSVSKTVEVEYISLEDIAAISVGELYNKEAGTEHTIRGIVSGSLVNKVGFYLVCDDGAIAVLCTNEMMTKVSIGNDIIIKGTFKTANHGNKNGVVTDPCVYSFDCSELVVNLGGKNEHSTKTFETMTLKEAVDDAKDINCTGKVYVVEAQLKVISETYYTSASFTDGTTTEKLYCSSAAQFTCWLGDYVNQTLKYEISFVNWNDSGYKVSILSVILEDGTRIYNPLNWN